MPPPRAGGPTYSIAVPLGALCVALFCAPAYFVTRGGTVAGDRQRESPEDILKINVNAVQRGADGGTKQ